MSYFKGQSQKDVMIQMCAHIAGNIYRGAGTHLDPTKVAKTAFITANEIITLVNKLPPDID